MIEKRRYFHENPELTGKELKTIEYLSAELTALGIEHVVIENGGILATIKGGKDGRAVLLRADVDGLPVQETPDNLKPGMRTCISKNPGVMHACGHDGHMAMLLGAAKILLDKKDEIAGTVYLCFERGEEASGNVEYIFPYIEKNNIQIDTVYGTHLLATYNSYGMPGYAVVNDEEMAQWARKVLAEELGSENVGQWEPWMASESYNQYLQQWPGVFAFLGIQNEEKGIGAAHHNQEFDIDEDVLYKGAAAAATYAIEYLKDDSVKGGRKMTYKQYLEKVANYKLLAKHYGE